MSRRALPLLLSFAAVAAALPLQAAVRAPDGFHVETQAAADHDTGPLVERLAEEARANIAVLEREGRLPRPTKVSGLGWPLGPAPGAGADWHGISNFVDLNPAFPNQLLDYNGGTRTYDLDSGYNHRGIDYFIWPFPWRLLDEGSVQVRAVAAGTLVGKTDGNGDRSCSFSAPDTPNYASVRHADGTMAYYLHMKNGSVTSLPIGSAVAAGTVLGAVGSSGISTGPHLHLELRASSSSGAAVIEPHTGPSNPGPSLFVNQRPYRDSAVNRLSTHSAPPVAPTCSGSTMAGTDVPNFKETFQPGESAYFLAAYRDQGLGQQTQYRILRPDLTTFQQWTHQMGAGSPAYYNASYWYWQFALPANAPHGQWIFEATFQGETTQHTFTVGNTTTAIANMQGLAGMWYEPSSSGQGFELHWINGNYAVLFFYAHHDDGSNFFLLGERNAGWDFGQEVEWSLYQTLGGRWNGHDPAQVTRPTWGTLRLTFVDCDHAVAELDGIDGTKVMSLERLGDTGISCDG